MAESHPDIDISPAHWQIVESILAEHLGGYEVWAFGSRARHTAKPYSDLDLAVITQTPLPLSILAATNLAFEESDLPWSVDLLDWASTSAGFKALIEQDHRVVQQSGRYRVSTNPQDINIQTRTVMTDLLDPTNDYVFKRLFAEAPDLLVDLINDLRPDLPNIESVEILNPNIEPSELTGKYIILDVLAKDGDGHCYNVKIHIRELSADEEARRLAFVRERALRDEVSLLNDARREEAQRILHRLLTKRFGDLPEWASQKLNSSNAQQLEDWTDEILVAKSLDELFKHEP